MVRHPASVRRRSVPSGWAPALMPVAVEPSGRATEIVFPLKASNWLKRATVLSIPSGSSKRWTASCSFSRKVSKMASRSKGRFASTAKDVAGKMGRGGSASSGVFTLMPIPATTSFVDPRATISGIDENVVRPFDAGVETGLGGDGFCGGDSDGEGRKRELVGRQIGTEDDGEVDCNARGRDPLVSGAAASGGLRFRENGGESFGILFRHGDGDIVCGRRLTEAKNRRLDKSDVVHVNAQRDQTPSGSVADKKRWEPASSRWIRISAYPLSER